MLPALQRKLFRDLARRKGQVLTISLVVACGIASFGSMRGNYAMAGAPVRLRESEEMHA